MFFSTRQIPQLQSLSLSQRLDALRKAEQKMTAPERLLLNLCKLIIIIPVFVLILRVEESWYSLLWAGLFILAYPLLLKPLQYSMSVKYLPDVTKKGESEPCKPS